MHKTYSTLPTNATYRVEYCYFLDLLHNIFYLKKKNQYLSKRNLAMYLYARNQRSLLVCCSAAMDGVEQQPGPPFVYGKGPGRSPGRRRGFN